MVAEVRKHRQVKSVRRWYPTTTPKTHQLCAAAQLPTPTDAVMWPPAVGGWETKANAMCSYARNGLDGKAVRRNAQKGS